MRSDTDGLVSGYQITQVTDGVGPTLETGGNLLVGVITFPHSEVLPLIPFTPQSTAKEPEKELESPNRLAIEMTENRLFLQLVESGLSDLEQGRYTKITKKKLESGVI